MGNMISYLMGNQDRKGHELDLQKDMLEKEASKWDNRLQSTSRKKYIRVNILCAGDTKARKHHFYKIIEEVVESVRHVNLWTDWIDEDEKYSCPCIIIFYLDGKEQIQSILQEEYSRLTEQLKAEDRKPIILIISTDTVSPETTQRFHTDTCYSVVTFVMHNFQLLNDESNSETVLQLTKYILSFTEGTAQDVQHPSSALCEKKSSVFSERTVNMANVIYSKSSQRFVSLLLRIIKDYEYPIRLVFNETNGHMPCIVILNRDGSDRDDIDEIIKHQTFEKAMMLVISDKMDDLIKVQPLKDQYNLCCVAGIDLSEYYNIQHALLQHSKDHQTKVSKKTSDGIKVDLGEENPELYIYSTRGKQNTISEYLGYLVHNSTLAIKWCSDIRELKCDKPCVIISYEVDCTADDISRIVQHDIVPVVTDYRPMVLRITDRDPMEVENQVNSQEQKYCCEAHINLKTYLDVLYQLIQHVQGFCSGESQKHSDSNTPIFNRAKRLRKKRDSTLIPVEVCCATASHLPRKAFTSFLERHLLGFSPLWVESGRKLTGTVPCLVVCFTLSRLTDDVNGVVNELHLPPGCKAMLVVIHNCTQGMNPGRLLAYYSNDKIECFTNILYADGICYSCDINDKAAAQVDEFIHMRRQFFNRNSLP